MAHDTRLNMLDVREELKVRTLELIERGHALPYLEDGKVVLAGAGKKKSDRAA